MSMDFTLFKASQVKKVWINTETNETTFFDKDNMRIFFAVQSSTNFENNLRWVRFVEKFCKGRGIPVTFVKD